MTETVSIRITRGTICGGRPVAPGETVEASKADANLLIGSRKAEIASHDSTQEGAPVLRISGAAAALADKLGIDPYTITGTGSGGSVTKSDVEAHISGQRSEAVPHNRQIESGELANRDA